MTGASSSVPSGELLARLRSQGRQLARLLHERQQDLDRREAQQNSHAADLDGQFRAARLWLTERHQELSERESQLADREQQFTAREQELSRTAAADSQARGVAGSALQKRSEEWHSARVKSIAWLSALTARPRRSKWRSASWNHSASAITTPGLAPGSSSTTIAAQAWTLFGKHSQISSAAGPQSRARRPRWSDAGAVGAAAQRPSPEQQRHARELTEIAEGLAAREQHLTEAEQLQVPPRQN